MTFRNAGELRAAAHALDSDKILVETDCPYLAPVPHRGKRNEPAFVVEVARQIAELRGLSREQVGERTSENFYDFFNLHSSNLSSTR